MNIEVGVGILADCRSDNLLRFDLVKSESQQSKPLKTELKSQFWGYPEIDQKRSILGVPSYQRQIFCRKCPNRMHLTGHDSYFSEKTRFGPLISKKEAFSVILSI